MTEPVTTRELDHRFHDFEEKLDLILEQTTKHNGRLTRIERVVLIVCTAIAVLLIVNGNELFKVFMILI